MFKYKYINQLRNVYDEYGEEGLSKEFMKYMDMTDVWEQMGAMGWGSLGMGDGLVMLMTDCYEWKRSLKIIFSNLYNERMRFYD